MLPVLIAIGLLFWAAGWKVGLALLVIALVLGMVGGPDETNDQEIPRAR